MIEQFFRPTTIEQAMDLKRRFQHQAVWFAGGSKLNATPTKTECKIAISLQNLPMNSIDWDNGTLRIGALTKLQQLRDTPSIPQALYEALGFIYSRHLRNQSTIGGEIAAQQTESVLLSVLLVLDTQLLCADGQLLSLEDYLAAPNDRLLSEIIIKKPFDHCSTGKISHSAAGWSVITAAVAISDNQEYRIALDGVGEKARRLHAIESLTLAGEELEKAVSNAIHPTDNLLGSAAYQRYIAGILISDLLTDCRQKEEKSK
ncbi:molybdopterin-dependent oxidoreductase FAD-binding subunit [Candidatus Arsenophonus nilaparvatae]|uniref:molybdopterin-dependent oxidoreductase FAD-binding subunit n=1 Tax=Candidatus Arsenophonus nilaparvatae TaxID=1247023 RepID=UPI000509CA3D|nr:molybdopterin-dependent oxidoreductase FAD-binding subunit [Candidatus Arsenophonus nilaparvatae]